MTRPAINSDVSKRRVWPIPDYVILAVCLCVVALRATYSEGPSVQFANHGVGLSEKVYSLILSAVLIVSFVVWFVWGCCSRRILCRLGWLEVGLCLFTVAAGLAGFFAANKRAAITGYVTLLAPVLMAIVLVQILDSPGKVRLVLTTVVALGVVCVYQCAEQFFYTNQMMIEQYQESPEMVLEPLGIEAGTFTHMLFEHRLLSRGVHGFFTTSNSAGSFALLTLFGAIVLFIGEFARRRLDESAAARLFACGVAAALIVFGLLITGSKGAIAAAIISMVMFFAYVHRGRWIRAHRAGVLITCVLFMLVVGCLAVVYGSAHGRLPGGNSMLVRWQYWRASAQMIADHPATGVGPGNFVYFYPRYKPASALETVADPHNLGLSMLTQYGPLGLVGFLVLVLAPLSSVMFSPAARGLEQERQRQRRFWPPALVLLILISAVLLIVRPTFIKMPALAPPGERGAAALMLYLMPVAAFVLGFLLATAGTVSSETGGVNMALAALVCGLLGVLIHNLVDFAIFESGVYTSFWVVIACVIALQRRQHPQPEFVMEPGFYEKLILVAAGGILIWVFFRHALMPVAGSIPKIERARQAASFGRFEQARGLLAVAAEQDPLSPIAPAMSSQVYLYQFESGAGDGSDLLYGARTSLLEAISRNHADFRHFERITEVHVLLADVSAGRQRQAWFSRAFGSASRATELYPGSGRLRFRLAEIAERLNDRGFAREQYKKAVEIEESYRRQFQRMYPGRELFSRLGEEKYESAKEKLRTLGEEQP